MPGDDKTLSQPWREAKRTMRATLTKLYQDISGSYWFVPTLMTLGAAGLSSFTILADRRFASAWLNQFSAFYPGQTATASAVLTAIAGSMITVAGVTFSMTIVAVSFASAQFGPRLIGNFMRDRGNQVTLGTFIATFVYCLLTMRVVRPQEAGDGDSVAAAFVPHLSVMFAIGLALASVAVLIYFIHHIPETINIGNLTARVGGELKRAICKTFPESAVDEQTDSGLDSDANELGQRDRRDDGARVQSTCDGYAQAISKSNLLEIAEDHDLSVQLRCRPGQFMAKGDALASIWPADRASEEIQAKVARCFAFGNERTASQDLMFLVDQLVEIMLRALSPGVNDPFTACACIDWLRAAIQELLSREPAERTILGADKQPRLLLESTTFEEVLEHVFGRSLQYVAADRNAALRMMRAIHQLRAAARDARRSQLLGRYADQLVLAASTRLPVAADRELLAEHHRLGRRGRVPGE